MQPAGGAREENTYRSPPGYSFLQAELAAGRFVLTSDLLPPRSPSLAALFPRVAILRGQVTAVNVADMPSATLMQGPLAAAARLVGLGIDTVLQLTCRDRNRLALQADLLCAQALGVSNVLCLTGDHTCIGDHPGAKPVFDLSSVHLLELVTRLNEGICLEGSPLEERAGLFAGAAVNPMQDPLGPQLLRAVVKERSGARFFQTQPLFLPEQAQSFLEAAAEAGLKAPILLGTFLLESPGAARFIEERVPGVKMPPEVLAGMERASDGRAYGRAVAADFLAWAREAHGRPAGQPRPAGVHLMSFNRFEEVAALAAGQRD